MERQGVCEKDGGGECHFILLFYIKAEMRVRGWKMLFIFA